MTTPLQLLCLAFLVATSFYDIKHHLKEGKGRIPNWLNLAAALLGLALHAVSGEFREAAAGFGWGFFFGIVFYVLGLFGAGDVKMLAAVGATVGKDLTFLTLLCGLACLVAWSAPLRIWKWGFKKFWEHEKQGLLFLAARIRLRQESPEKFDLSRLPLAPFVAAGYCLAVLLKILGVITL